MKEKKIQKMKKKVINFKGTDISILEDPRNIFISLSDIIKPFGNEAIRYNWLQNKNTIEFLGLLEILNNPLFKPIEFNRFKSMSGVDNL